MFSFKFAHMSDVHLDSWREPELKMLNLDAFKTAMQMCISEKIDFLLISGDLFHTAAPDYDIVASAASELKKLKDSGIRAYVIPGSHDFSYSQKTILNVLENAGLFVNVAKGEVDESSGKLKLRFTTDDKTNVKLIGILGKKGQLEKSYYEVLDKESLENETGFKIFMFHSGIEEYKPKHLEKMEAIPLSLFPKNFSYYAGGHIHHPFDADESQNGYGKIVMPGALYPVNFDELQKNKFGQFLINEVSDGKISSSRRIKLEMKKVEYVEIDADGLSANETEEKIKFSMKTADIKNKIVLLKVKGILSSGKPADIRWNVLDFLAKDKGSFAFKRNINKLSSKEFEEIQVQETTDLKELERKLIDEHITPGKKELALSLLKSFELEKEDSETNATFEGRVAKEGKKILEN